MFEDQVVQPEEDVIFLFKFGKCLRSSLLCDYLYISSESPNIPNDVTYYIKVVIKIIFSSKELFCQR